MSKYACETYEHRDPVEDPRGFVDDVAEAAMELDSLNIMPTGDVPTYALLEGRERLPQGARLLVGPAESLALAHDKVRLMELAASLAVPIPPGFAAEGDVLRDARLERLSYPLVLKPARSRYFEGGRWRSASVAIVPDRRALERVLGTVPAFSGGRRFLVQEWVPGEGRGVFVLAHAGEIDCVFAHRRLREKPPWGGKSTLCEVATADPVLVKHSAALMAALGWSGVAMLEYRYDPESGNSWLMEINGRYWGSLELAIAAGVDFPWLHVRRELLGLPPGAVTIDPDVRMLWLLGDLDQFLIRLKTRGLREFPGILGDALRRTRSGHRMSYDTFSTDDPGPFLLELREWIAALVRRG
jgi:predicted ATP-grasp superfamily ATP-dependent carboligase